MQLIKRLLWLLLILLTVFVIGFIGWATIIPDPMPEAIAALNSDENVTVATDDNRIVFAPTGKETTSGVVIYPGGRVDARAYAPLAKEIAQAGYQVVIVPMPLNLAVLAPNRAVKVIEDYESIKSWSIGGHSLGGAMAANFVYNQPDLVDALFLWASFPAEGNNLAQSPIQAISIYGTQDGLATVADVEASRSLLPASTEWVAIEGGNHAQFGWYGEQSGDLIATMSRDEQQKLIAAATIDFLNSLNN